MGAHVISIGFINFTCFVVFFLPPFGTPYLKNSLTDLAHIKKYADRTEYKAESPKLPGSLLSLDQGKIWSQKYFIAISFIIFRPPKR